MFDKLRNLFRSGSKSTDEHPTTDTTVEQEAEPETEEVDPVFYRHGDIGLKRTGPPTDDVDHEPGAVTLAFGEKTGHSHVLQEAIAEEKETPSEVVVQQEAELTHEEHDTIHVEPGTYTVVRQQEYDPTDKQMSGSKTEQRRPVMD